MSANPTPNADKTQSDVPQRVQLARDASFVLATQDAAHRNAALRAIADALQAQRQEILAANQRDTEQAQSDGLSPALLKRLLFDNDKLDQVIAGITATQALPDPLGKTLEARELDTGLRLYRRTVPVGVLGFIFESRPDALVQIATLAIKSGNAAVLKGGTEAEHTNTALVHAIHSGLAHAGLPEHSITHLQSRADVRTMITLDTLIDLVIPRGSNEFVRSIMQSSLIPVLGHADGICHVYVDQSAQPKMAADVVVDSKTQYTAVCNAMETLLVHAQYPHSAALITALLEAGVTLHGCPRTQKLSPAVKPADDSTWTREYLDMTASVRIVDSLDSAIDHINRHGSHHTDAIITESPESAGRFLNEVDSSSVLHNCSTRFADGYRYGLGAEVGVATGKIHARGPVGLEGLVSSKWVLYGAGHVVSTYHPPTSRRFTHRPL